MGGDYLNPEMETLTPSELLAVQESKLEKQVEYVYELSLIHI